jgi:hypothetical protein
MDRQSILATYGIPIASLPRSNSNGNNNSSNNATRRTIQGRSSKRYSVTALYSMAAEQDVEVEDDLSRGVYMNLLMFFIPYSFINY